MSSDEKQHLETLRQAYQRRLWLLEAQAAQLGFHTPPHIQTEIEDLQHKLAQLDAQLHELETLPAEIGSGVVTAPFNLSFDLPERDGLPPGWWNSLAFVTGVSTAYVIQVEARPDTGGQCVRLQSIGNSSDEFGSLMQRCPAKYMAGHTLLLEGEVRTENLDQWAGLWLRADGLQPNLYFYNMHDRPIRGTTPWRTYTIVAHLPQATTWINYGVLLEGRGTVWADNFRLLVQDYNGVWFRVSEWQKRVASKKSHEP